MNRVHFLRLLMANWLPLSALATLLGMAMFFGTAAVEAAIALATDGLLAKLVGIVIVMSSGLYYYLLMITNDPLWPMRKRIWLTGNLFLLLDDALDADEPLIWNVERLPEGSD